MITWMTRMSFFDTAEDLELTELVAVLDHTYDILAWLLEDGIAVKDNHPILQAWTGFEPALATYAVACSTVLLTRHGVTEASHLSTTNLILTGRRTRTDEEGWDFELPPWFSDTDVLLSHRSNLARRWPDRYGRKWGKVPKNMPYIWPFLSNDGYDLKVSKHDKDLLASGERQLSDKIRGRIYNLA